MLYHLAHYLYAMHDRVSVLSVLRVVSYITVRTAAASLTAFAVGLFLGPWFIRRLREFQIGQVDRGDTPDSHKAKAGTPTMGGILIIASVVIPTLLWSDLRNVYIWIAVLSMLAFGAVGFADDYLKITRHDHHGLSERHKLISQTVVAVVMGAVLLWLAGRHPALYSTRLVIPFFKNWIPDLGVAYALFALVVLVGATNAVNLTDGLDGLAISVFAVSAAAFTVLAYVNGNRVLAEYLGLLRFTPAGEAGQLTIFCGALVGGSLGFLWWNAHPADMFMGDVGSLALGGALGTVAILLKQELLLPIVGGVFVFEALSVIIQRGSYKLRGGKRVFKMAPIHHHFELIGWKEPKIITRFQILAILFAVLAIITLKLR
jgi:phospho-N-acetylmuramoyl-pentapeptide-transferase